VFRAAVLAVTFAVFPAAWLAAQDAPRPPAQRESGQQQQRPPGEGRLPAAVATRHTVSVGGRALAFTATAGALVLTGENDAPEAEIAYVAYVLDGSERANRPVSFVVNGGPGSASAWLHLGALGPWRLSMEAADLRPSAPAVTVENPETWLPFTDLVFIDPAGTGFSRLIGDGEPVRQRYYSVDGDVQSLATFIRRWLIANGRLASPKAFVGESYGGFRGPRLARILQVEHGIGLSALVLVSPVLDFAWRGQGQTSPLPWAARLPSLAAIARESRGPIARADLADVEAYARGEFVIDFLRGRREDTARARMADRVAAFTGLDPAFVRRLGARIDGWTFLRERTRDEGLVGSGYDGSVLALDPFPDAFAGRTDDAFSDAVAAPLTSAMVDHFATRLGYRPARRYLLLNRQVNGAWQWGRGRFAPPEVVSDLARVMALDPTIRVLVAHGLTDVVTPYFESQLLIDQLPPLGPAGRIQLATYPGGHMFYSRAASRRAFLRDVEALYAPPAPRTD